MPPGGDVQLPRLRVQALGPSKLTSGGALVSTPKLKLAVALRSKAGGKGGWLNVKLTVVGTLKTPLTGLLAASYKAPLPRTAFGAASAAALTAAVVGGLS